MQSALPDAGSRPPITLPDGRLHKGTVFLEPAIGHPRVSMGDETYANAHEPPEGGVARRREIAWWSWPIARIRAHEAAICGADLSAIEAAAAGC